MSSFYFPYNFPISLMHSHALPGPVLEVTEVDSEDGGPDEEEQDPKFFDNNRDVTEETKVGQHTLHCIPF